MNFLNFSNSTLFIILSLVIVLFQARVHSLEENSNDGTTPKPPKRPSSARLAKQARKFENLKKTISESASISSNSSGCDMKAMESCSQQLTMIGDVKFEFPLNVVQMNDRCRQIKPLENCVKTYSKLCLSSHTSQAISVLLYGITRTNRKICTNQKKKQDFISIGECGNKNRKLLNKAMEEFLIDSHGILQFKSDKKITIPMICCTYHKFKNSFIKIFDERCAGKTESMEILLDGYVNDILNVGCGEFTDDSNRCNPIMEKIPKWTKALKYKDFVVVLAQIIDQF